MLSQQVNDAARDLKNHAWLERFRKATYANGYHELSPECCFQIAGYVDGFIDLVLSDRPSLETRRLIEAAKKYRSENCRDGVSVSTGDELELAIAEAEAQ